MSKPPSLRSRAVIDRDGRERAWEVEWHPRLTSTMDRAQALAEGGAAEGAVVVADYQEQGRGTRGRSWIAPPGACLTFTFVLRPAGPPEQLADLPLLIAEHVAGVLRERFALAARVKSPNDVVIEGRKICGVLCVSRVRANQIEWVICGIGLNTTLSLDELPTPNATSLALEGVTPPSHEDLLAWLLGALGDLRG